MGTYREVLSKLAVVLPEYLSQAIFKSFVKFTSAIRQSFHCLLISTFIWS